MTSMITNRVRQHEVLLPINQNYVKICDIFSFFKIKTQDFFIPRILASSEKKKKIKYACAMACTVQLLSERASYGSLSTCLPS